MKAKQCSRRQFIQMTSGILAAGTLSGCGQHVRRESEPVDLDEMIGQMLMVGFRGTRIDASDSIAVDIRDRSLGGVVLFDYDVRLKKAGRNITSPEQLQKLTTQLQSVSDTPLLIAVDQEGGRVARLKEKYGFPASLSHSALGQHADTVTTYQHARIIAQTLAEAGVNMNLAPVVDVCVNSDNPVIAKLGRCFSADPQHVADHAAAFIRAHHELGINCCLKHFPGHGSSTADSHLGLVDVTETWTEAELEPYRRLIQAGAADTVMTAHVFNATLDATYPATLSKATIQGLLREKLRFGGVVVSDDMQMGAITQHYGLEAAVEQSILAGVDILVFGNNLNYDPEITQKAITVVKNMVATGTISDVRINQSWQRIQQFKGDL
ncbi:MAG: glycoside hydrolase family 3 protein [Planctomycetota bacterium]